MRRHGVVQCSALQCSSAVQSIALQCSSEVQYIAVLRKVLHYITVHCSKVIYIVHYIAVLYSALNCTALHYIEVHYSSS